MTTESFRSFIKSRSWSNTKHFSLVQVFIIFSVEYTIHVGKKGMGDSKDSLIFFFFICPCPGSGMFELPFRIPDQYES